MDWLDDLERKAKAATPFRYMADPWDERDGDFIAAASPDVVLRLIRALRDAQLSLGHFPDGLDAEVRVNRILAGKEPTP